MVLDVTPPGGAVWRVPSSASAAGLVPWGEGGGSMVIP
jgi:hypothetical protein